jgi:hypothetical protein
MNTLFYKHEKDVLINNLGPFGSSFYYPSILIVPSKNLHEKQDLLRNKLYNLERFKPYTNIIYINASRKEQQFSVTHVQGFGKLLSLDFKFDRRSSPGAFLNQEANNTLFNSNLKYKSKRKNYEVKFTTSIIKKTFQQNGGLNNTQNYELQLFNDDQNYIVNLNNSSSFEKRSEFSLEQRLDLFHFNLDSNTQNKIYLKHKVSFTQNQKVFYDNDPLSSIYTNIFLDSISSVDSIYNDNISNTGFVGLESDNFNIDLFGEYDLKKYEQRFGLYADYHNTYGGLMFKYHKNKLKFRGIAKYAIAGYRKGDVESETIFSLSKNKYVLSGGISYYLNEPDLKFLNYTSNHFKWTNTSFIKQSLLGGNVLLKWIKFGLDAEIESKFLNNTFYFDSLTIASQSKGSSSITSFRLGKNYKVLNFHFRTAFIYQITSDEILFPLPELVARQIVYYQKHIFKKALKFQIGIGISYSTDYFGYAYMPAINEFYVQNRTKIGDYPQFDVFINTKLKRAQIFLKYEHINAGSNLTKSYAVPGYPILNKSLKFGVSWNMFD